MKVASAEQMRRIDLRAIVECGIPPLLLMEHAAFAVIDRMERRFGTLAAKRIVVVCGTGNNGGDGFAIARLLVRRAAAVQILLPADPQRLQGEALSNYRMLAAYNLEVLSSGLDDISLARLLAPADIVVDALLGTGLRGAVTGEFVRVIEQINLYGKKVGKTVVAVDVPSGLSSDSGDVSGPAVKAHLTVTFSLPKYGLLVFPGALLVGALEVVDIGIPSQIMASEKINVHWTEASDIGCWLPKRINERDVNKGSFGHVIVVCGSRNFVGAPVLTAESAMRTGSGLVTVAVPDCVHSAVISLVSPVAITQGLLANAAGGFAIAAMTQAEILIESVGKKASAVALGPGMGTADETAEFVFSFIEKCRLPMVIDADALNIIAADRPRAMSLLKTRAEATVLTPHPSELARLLGLTTAAIQSDRRSAVSQAALDFGCVVVLKGASTLIADANGDLSINGTGNAGMSTAGTGDVLTGIIATLLAQKLNAHVAAVAGAYLHGLAGDLAANQNFTGLIATDVIACLRQAIAHCQEPQTSA